MNARVSAWENGAWVRDAAVAYAEKQEKAKSEVAQAS